MIATIPAFTALWVVAFLGERMGGWGWLGVAISIVGIALISFGKGRGFGVEPGALLVLLAALSTSAYFALQKPYLKRYGSFELTAYAFARLPASRAVTLESLVPPVAILVAYLWLGEVPTLLSLAGGARRGAGQHWWREGEGEGIISDTPSRSPPRNRMSKAPGLGRLTLSYGNV